MNKAVQLVEEIRLLTPRQLAFRVGYEFLNRTGLRKRLTPVIDTPPTLANLPTRRDWMANLPADHWLVAVTKAVTQGQAKRFLHQRLDDDAKQALLRRAEAAIQGRIRCFSRWEADYGAPVDWHWSPSRMVSWPANVHWSEIYECAARCGDIKDVWEINRFPHLYDWVRAYAVTGDSTWVRAFADQLHQWEAANPYRSGANWASGQELAIRLLAWTFAVAAMGGDPAFTEEDFQCFLRLVYRHAEHIEDLIGYARWAVHNNHLIGEALGLYAVGSVFPFFTGAQRWRDTGLALLTGPCLEQFYDDGGYCQSSNNYHRLALHYLLWAFRLLPSHENDARAHLARVMKRSAEQLASFQNEDGRLPNRGANDGALLNPWTSCDYSDFRPLLTALRFATTGRRAYADGPWDEELFWFWDVEATRTPMQPFALNDRLFSTSGVHILRDGPGDFASFRCGTLNDRFAQADQLHVDIFWRGLNIAQDGGSYRYNDELAFHDWFMGTGSHNTVCVDDRDQMRRIRRFKWINWPTAKAWPCGADALRGYHDGYERVGVTHHRTVRRVVDGWDIVDDIENAGNERKLTLHWLLIDGPYSVEEVDQGTFRVTFDTEKGTVVIRISCEPRRHSGRLLASPCLMMQRAIESPAPRGWISRYYGDRQPALSVTVSTKSSSDIRFTSSFRFPDYLDDVGRE